MEIVNIDNPSRVLGAPKNWDNEGIEVQGLPIIDTEIEGSPVMISFWNPSREELTQLKRGHAIALLVYGTGHPVVAVGVSADPMREVEPDGPGTVSYRLRYLIEELRKRFLPDDTAFNVRGEPPETRLLEAIDQKLGTG